MRKLWAAHLGLVALVAFVYLQSTRHEFLNFDDQLVVTDNPRVQDGLTPRALRWAWTTGHFANWMPLTWMSHQLDWQLFGDWAGGHHLTSVFLHLAGVLLLFDSLRLMTGVLGGSFLVAALYAVHPLHVESVAWISERKGILGSLFWMLSMRLYASYAATINPWMLAAAIAAMVCGLLAKQMLVTLPLVLLLLDAWPLARWDGSRRCFGLLVAEKIPMFVAAGAFSVVAFLFQSGGNAVANLDELPLRYRLTNAAFSSVVYLRRVVWPSDLSVFYPHPLDALSMGTIAGSVSVLLILTALACIVVRRLPFVTVGWLWYLVALLPVIGFVPIGRHGMADRYSDIPLIGIHLGLVWSWRALAERLAIGRTMRIAVAAVVIASIAAAGFIQTSHWKSSRSLFEHVLRIDPDNAMALNQIGALAVADRKFATAMRYFDASIAIDPGFPVPRSNRARLLREGGDLRGALAEFRIAADLGDPRAFFEAARIEAAQGRPEVAIDMCQSGLNVLPDDPDGLGLLGYFLLASGQWARAEATLERAIAVAPDFADAHRHLAVLRLRQGNVDSARDHFATACSLDPRLISAVEAIAKDSSDLVLLEILAASLSRVGRMPEAIELQRTAVALADMTHRFSLLPSMKERLKMYESGTPYAPSP